MTLSLKNRLSCITFAWQISFLNCRWVQLLHLTSNRGFGKKNTARQLCVLQQRHHYDYSHYDRSNRGHLPTFMTLGERLQWEWEVRQEAQRQACLLFYDSFAGFNKKIKSFGPSRGSKTCWWVRTAQLRGEFWLLAFPKQDTLWSQASSDAVFVLFLLSGLVSIPTVGSGLETHQLCIHISAFVLSVDQMWPWLQLLLKKWKIRILSYTEK